MLRISGPRMRRELATELAEDALYLVQTGFAQGKDPYGRNWKPPKKRRGQPMLDTGRLRASWGRTVRGAGFSLDNRTAYAGPLQSGTKFMAARMQVPSGTRHSPIWYARFRHTHAAFVRRRLGRRR